MSNREGTNIQQRPEKEPVSVKYFSSPTSSSSFDERQRLDSQEKQKARNLLPASTFSFFPTTHNVTSLSANNDDDDDDGHHSSLPSTTEQQHQQQYFHQPSTSSPHYDLHSSEQTENIEDKSHLCSLFDKFEQVRANEDLDLSDILEETSSFASGYSLSDTIVDKNHTTDNQTHHLTSTPILPSSSSSPPHYHHQRTRKTNLFSPVSIEKTSSKPALPSTFASNDDYSSTISTTALVNDLQRQAELCQLNNMSTLSNLTPTNPATAHTYDQRITDQGQKYLIQLKTDDFQENDFILTPRYSSNQLIIEAKHREEDSSGGYVHRELRKIFNIPKHIDLHQYAYFYHNDLRELTVEMPYLSPATTTTNTIPNDTSYLSSISTTTEPLSHSSGKCPRTSDDQIPATMSSISHDDSGNTSGIGTDSTLMRSSNTESTFGKNKPFDFDLFHRSAFRPQIVRTTSNENKSAEKKLLMSLDLSDYQAEDIKVSIKDRELIVKAERKIETNTRKSRTSFFQSTSLPPQTDIEHLRSNFDHGKLIIEAPYLEQTNSTPPKQTTHW